MWKREEIQEMLRSIVASPRGIFIFGLLLILGSLYKLSGFIRYDYYVFMFQQLPAGGIGDRYIISIAYRLVGLVTAGGLLLRREWARQIFLCLCIFTLATLYWKHPYSVFENIAIYQEWLAGINELPKGTITESTYPIYPQDLGGYQLARPEIPRTARVLHSLIDLVFCGSAIYYFTRKNIFSVFKNKSHESRA